MAFSGIASSMKMFQNLAARQEELEVCNKYTGTLTQLRGHSRGILPVISGRGHIHSFVHVYRSESLSQVAIFVEAFFLLMLLIFKEIPKELWSSTKFFLSYDNVCNLANMKLWREPLPIKMLPNLWHDHLVKIIDSVHLHNHRRESCKTDFNPAILKKELPGANTMICEETFAWLSRYKKKFKCITEAQV